MNDFEGIEHVCAEGTSDRSYFEPGHYIVEIEKVILHKKRSGGGKLFIVETAVKESNNPKIQIGEQRNWVQSLSSEYALPRIKSFIGAAMGFCSSKQAGELNAKISSTVCLHVVSEENPLKGKIVALRCIAKKTREGKDFTQAQWGVQHG